MSFDDVMNVLLWVLLVGYAVGRLGEQMQGAREAERERERLAEKWRP